MQLLTKFLGLNFISNLEASVEQYTGYVVILQYYFPVLSNFFDTAVL